MSKATDANDSINHELESGDVLETDSEAGLVKRVGTDGSVKVNWTDGYETHSEEAICNALAHGEIERTDGKSHELVKSF